MPRSKLLLSGIWRPPVRISSLQSSSGLGVHRATLKVAGEEVWFESPDLSLANSVEAIGAAFLIPAATAGRRLVFPSPPDDVWLSNARQAQRVAAEWWGYGCAIPSGPSAPISLARPDAARRTALCFTGGVDSFYSLLRGDHRVDHLMFVHGYDMELADTNRAQAMEASLRAVAAAWGQHAILVRTNLRTHRLFRRANWEHAHGGALAAVGHLLSDHVNQLLISASYPRVFDRPWGSHWALDPWWSSSRLTVTHVGAEKWRAEKLVAIMNEPLVRQHLRVCWENRSPTGNCGQCEKCLRTMLVLDGHGCLGEFPVFPAASLAANLDQLPSLKPDLIRVYAGFLELALSASVRSALTGLLIRSGSQPAHGESRRAQRV
jgi:hypothetical protein